MRRSMFTLLALVWLAVPGQVAQAEDEAPLTAKDLKDAKVSLEDGLKASEAQGKPISAKYEVEKGKLQLSVYTAKGDKFSEVVVDHKSGKVAKAAAIDEGDDLKAAKEQNAAMAKAKESLRAAVAKAVGGNEGYRAVSAFPKLDGDHAVVQVTLVKGTESRTVTQKLD